MSRNSGFKENQIVAVREKLNTKRMQAVLLFFEVLVVVMLALFGLALQDLWWISALILGLFLFVFLLIQLNIIRTKKINKLPKAAIAYDGYKMFSLVTFQGKFNVFFDDIIELRAEPSRVFLFKLSYGSLIIQTKHMTFKMKNISQIVQTCAYLKDIFASFNF